jgi:hypothetical protein
VLRLTTSSGEEPDDEEPDTPKVPSELEIVLEEIKEAKSTLAKYEAWFANDGEKGVTAEDTREAKRTLNLLLAEKARLEASSAPSCATGVVRKHFLREGGSGVVDLLNKQPQARRPPRGTAAGGQVGHG